MNLSMTRDLTTLSRHSALINYMVSRRKKAEVMQSLLGQAWYILEPLANIAIHYFVVVIVFGHGRGTAAERFVVLCMGITHYSILQRALSESMLSIVGNEGLLRQVKIEPLVFIAAAYLRSIYNSAPSLICAYFVFYCWGPPLSLRCLFYPFLLVFLLMIAWAACFLAATLFVFVRDLQKVVPVVMRIGMYLAPVIYELHFIPQKIRLVYLCNPIASLFAAMQWCLFPQAESFPPAALLWMLAVGIGAIVFAHAVYGKLKIHITKAL